MLKKIITRYLPNNEVFQKHPRLRYLGKLLHDENLWHINRRSIPSAVSIGLFVCFTPLPCQMLIAALGAILLSANLPLAVALVWISNPITMPAMLYYAYRLGQILLFQTDLSYQWTFTVDSIFQNIGQIWRPLVVGTLVCGIIAAIVGNVLVRVLWRLATIHRWKKRG